MMRELCSALVAFTGLLAGLAAADDTPAAKPDATQPAKQKSALEFIEGVRGGRHWVDEATAPPKSPQESLKCLQIEPGFEIQLFAAEPLVRDPVAITFDRHGRMFVVEYGDYPIGPKEGGEPLSRIVCLEDTDGDGVADVGHLFADKLNFAHSLMALDGGLVVGAKTQILFLKDTDGDHVADIRKVLFDGFTPAHPQMQIGNPRWEIDNWISWNYGPGKITSAQSPEKAVEMLRKDFRYDPATMLFEADSGMGQFGNTVDRWGTRFFCTNRHPIMTSLLSPRLMTRNPFAVITQGEYDVGKSGGETRVYPLVEMKSNYLSHAGTHTSACGVTAYTGDLFPKVEGENVFVCEPIGHLVTRSLVKANGVTLTAERAREKEDFLASTDTWFRPASLANGPDGTLYLADMYRLWVEHPKFLPEEIAAKLDWRAGDDRGRIYRIVPKAAEPRPFSTPNTTNEMVALLEDPIGWRQFLGQRLLVREQHRAATPALRKVLSSSELATARLHALWTLDGLKALEKRDVVTAMADDDPHVRRDAVRLAARWLDDDDIASAVLKLTNDSDARVRFETVLTLEESERPDVTDALSALTLRDGHDPYFVTGLLTAVATRSSAILERLIADSEFVAHSNTTATSLVEQLSTVVGTRGDIEELASLLKVVSNERPEGLWWRAAIITGLGTGLPRHRGDLGRISLAKLLETPPEKLASSVDGIRRLLQRVQQVAVDAGQASADRAAAVRLLTYQPFQESEATFHKLLSSGQPVDVQLACIDALADSGSSQAAPILLAHLPQLGPETRGPALTVLLRRTDSTLAMLRAMQTGKMRPAALDVDQRVRLLKHSDPAIKSLAEDLFGGAVSTNRRQVAQDYEKALTLEATASAGAVVFKKICAKCHRLDREGHLVGPDISDVRNRSRAALLYDILDPNAKVEPRFTAYTVVTLDGKVFNGLIAAETPEAVVLRMAEAKEQVISRDEIDQMQASQISLMPEGVEKDVSIQEMADLLEFLKSRK